MSSQQIPERVILKTPGCRLGPYKVKAISVGGASQNLVADVDTVLSLACHILLDIAAIRNHPGDLNVPEMHRVLDRARAKASEA